MPDSNKLRKCNSESYSPHIALASDSSCENGNPCFSPDLGASLKDATGQKPVTYYF